MTSTQNRRKKNNKVKSVSKRAPKKKRNRSSRTSVINSVVIPQSSSYGTKPIRFEVTKISDKTIRLVYPIQGQYESAYFQNPYGSFFLIPLDPYFYAGQPLNTCIQFSDVTVKRAVIHLCPNVGTMQGGHLYVGSFDHGIAFSDSNSNNSYFTDCLNKGTGELAVPWMPTDYVVESKYLRKVLGVKRSEDDLAAYVVIVCPDSVSPVSNWCTPVVEMDVELGQPTNVVFDNANIVAPMTFKLSGAGLVRTDTYSGTNCLGYIVAVSDIGFLDEGNTVMIPAVTQNGVSDPNAKVICNGIVVNNGRYTNAPNMALVTYLN